MTRCKGIEGHLIVSVEVRQKREEFPGACPLVHMGARCALITMMWRIEPSPKGTII